MKLSVIVDRWCDCLLILIPEQRVLGFVMNLKGPCDVLFETCETLVSLDLKQQLCVSQFSFA